MKWSVLLGKCTVLRTCIGVLSIILMALFWSGTLTLPRSGAGHAAVTTDPFGNQTAPTAPSNSTLATSLRGRGVEVGPKSSVSAIVLLGDSILNNEHYVSFSDTVFAHLKEEAGKASVPVFQYAEDNALMTDVSQQIELMTGVDRFNTPSAKVVLSVGGNHLLNKRPFQLSATVVDELFSQWKEVLAKLKTRLPNASVLVLNIYEPSNPLFSRYTPFIAQWNQLVAKNADNAGQTYDVVDVHALLNSADDFVADVEPSASGGKKIASAIWLAASA